MKKLYEENVMQEIADTIRAEGQFDDEMRHDEMPYYIRRIKKHKFVECDMPLSDTTQIFPETWTRPSEWEDVSQIDYSEFTEVVYLSLYRTPETPWALGLYITAQKGVKIEYGHVVNNAFVPMGDPELLNSNTAYSKTLPEDETTLVVRITNQNYLYPITYFGYSQITAAAAGTPVAPAYYYQPVVERVGSLPYITSIASSGTSRGFSSCITERDALRFGEYTSVTNISNGWANSWKLRVLDIGDLETSHWKPASLSATWQNCYSLKNLDLNNWDTSNWKITNISNTWANCYMLENLNINQWNTIGWAVTTLASAWSNCKKLTHLNVNDWDTTNWIVTSLSATWQHCWLLEDLVLSHWNTTNWAVTTLGSAWSNCYSLKNLDLNNWNTTNWAVTTLTSTFDSCRMLEEIRFDKWNTTNWKVNTLSGFFSNCWNLMEVDLSSWNVENWGPVTNLNMFSANRKLQRVNLDGWGKMNINITATTSSQVFFNFSTESWSLKEVIIPDLDLRVSVRPTFLSALFSNCYSLEKVDVSGWKLNAATNTMANMFNNCYNLRELDLSTWDLTDTQVTTLANTFYNCRSLRTLDISTWDTSKWVVTTLASTWTNCYSLTHLDLSQWDVSNWKPTTMASIFGYCYSLDNCPITNWNMSGWSTLTTVASTFAYCRNLSAIDIELPTTANITTYQYFADGCDKLQHLYVGTPKHTGTSNPLVPGNSVYQLTDLYPVASTVAQNYSAIPNLSRESLLRILNTLPTAPGARTLTLGNSRAKLTTAEIAIATSKGWTVA